MPLDIAVLAASVVTSYMLPYVKDGAAKIAEAVIEKATAPAADYVTGVARKVTERVRAVFSSDDDRAVLAQFEKRPAAAAPLVEEILKEKLQQDTVLAEELDRLVNEPGPDGSSANLHISQVVGDVGTLYMPNANFSNSSHVRLAGVMKNQDNRADG